MTFKTHFAEAANLINASATDAVEAQMARAVDAIAASLAADKALLVCGNGGSASDALHIAGELVAQFMKKRRALKAICLGANMAALTAWANDYSYESAYARQVEAFGEAGGVLLGLSTSGNSKNVVAALERAKAMGMMTIGMTGAGGGKMAALCDILLEAPSRSTPAIQQVHICMYHYLCAEVEARFEGVA
ncbi:MAG TPA: SIS domain-containing protein [Rhizomicrobium sp.]|nr:SIS domain-containing protein [Rhizomicrobium sp.]